MAQKIAEEIKRLRMKAFMTRIKLARVLGVTENTIYNWEIGRFEPSASQMDKIRGLKEESCN